MQQTLDVIKGSIGKWKCALVHKDKQVLFSTITYQAGFHAWF